MVGFIIGICLSCAVFLYVLRKKDEMFRSTLKEIHAGKARPDASGNVGWG